ncbi:MAG TPA: hypothetical protein VFF33_03745 [Ignavibacteriaceae bacterium]|nr:hypothetical protein [Ignavibacteriaceae bacterium]
MKKILYIIFSMFIIFVGCKKEDANPIENSEGNDYFPNNNGNRYVYTIIKIDSTGAQTEGTRTTWYEGTANFNGNNYQNEHDSIVITNQQPVTNITHFRKTSTGVYYFVDTTGLYQSIPDSLLNYVTISNEIQPFAFPLDDGKKWTVFRLDLNYGPLTLTLIDVQGTFEGKENVTLNLDSGQKTVEAAKVKYELTLKAVNPLNPLLQITSKYNTYAWLAPGIGVVKWEGNATLPNAISGSGVDFSDSTTTITTTLKSYTIK